MNTIQIIYLIASTASVAAMWPQIKQLLVTKRSDELSFSTWITWTAYQCTSLAYSISIGAVPYIIVNIAWITFYVIMLSLMFKYRNNLQTIEAHIND